MNARFWVYLGGWVKLTLRPGQCLSWHSCGRTEEGWSSQSEQWEHAGDGVIYTWSDDGADCDGRLSSGGDAFCPLSHLRARDMEACGCACCGDEAPENAGIMAPLWKSAHAWQQDCTAEAAGY